MNNNTAQLAQEIQQAQADARADDERILYEGEAAIALREAVKNLGLHWVLKELADYLARGGDMGFDEWQKAFDRHQRLMREMGDNPTTAQRPSTEAQAQADLETLMANIAEEQS